MRMNNPIAIEVDSVSKNFKLPQEKVTSLKGLFLSGARRKVRARSIKTQHALRDINFSVKEGEFFGIVGRNGSGKSTLLKIIAGIYQPTRGKVTVNGRLVPFIELGVGFNPELSGRENVYLNGALMGFHSSHIDSKYEDIVRFAELEKFMDQKLKNYSSGMQVRLAFSVATILAQSDILLIDEVLAVGDADFQRKCYRYFKRLKRQKKTVIFVTHDMGAVREYCDRAILIEDSHLVAEGKPNEVAQQYERLMQPDNEAGSSDQSATRWGDGTLHVQHAGVKEINDNTIVLDVSLVAKKDCTDPMTGFSIKNEAGVILVGTNTALVNKPLKPMKKGDVATISWELSNALSDGVYTVAVSAQYDSGMTNGDWWDDACTITVSRPVHNPFPIYPHVVATVERAGKRKQ